MNRRTTQGRSIPTAVLLTAVLLATALFLSACAAGVPSEPPAITGFISNVTKAGDGATFLVAGTGQVTQASVFVDARTTLMRETDNGSTSALLTEFTAGSRVRVWFDGPVAESFPVQGHAGTVLLLKR